MSESPPYCHQPIDESFTSRTRPRAVTSEIRACSPFLPSVLARDGPWHVDQFDLHERVYKGRCSRLYKATDRRSGMTIALKLYRKHKLSVLNR